MEPADAQHVREAAPGEAVLPLGTESGAKPRRERTHQRRVVRADEPGPGPGAEALTLLGDPPPPRLGEESGTREPGTTRPEVASPGRVPRLRRRTGPKSRARGPDGALRGALRAGPPTDGRPGRSTRAGSWPGPARRRRSPPRARRVRLSRRPPPLRVAPPAARHARRKRAGLLGARGEDRAHEHRRDEEREVGTRPGPSKEARRLPAEQPSKQRRAEPSESAPEARSPRTKPEDREDQRTDAEVLPAPAAHRPPPGPRGCKCPTRSSGPDNPDAANRGRLAAPLSVRPAASGGDEGRLAGPPLGSPVSSVGPACGVRPRSRAALQVRL